MKSLIVMFGLLVLSTSQALAVDVVNNDEQIYTIRVISRENGTGVLTMPAMTSKENVCTKSCRIEVVGVGSIEASYNEVVIIRRGKLTTP
jgi:hypothetical protein